ncbi:hypothetical protein M758_7G162300 [Ceratodon purpureus]|uniref:Uncharacterized protein n=1 Tax=Ceratodon purpureus TaxID=3225 RepID=A0A8T0H5C4_CERPU|nr:hypothetical protein KC19_7G118300 [Ceratodon purpureus]KAG0611753.1 hypothetical protein M758_7G162300 [Ceratodon purpureus]
MADRGDGEGEEVEDWQPPRRMSAMGVEVEPDLEAPLLGTLEVLKPQSRVAPLLVLLVFIIVVIVLASMMGNLSSRYEVRSTSLNDTHPP